MVSLLNQSVKQPGLKLVKAYREYHINNLKNILIQVKQRLIDTLLNLVEEFPKIDEVYDDSKENSAKVQNIINYNVFGGNPISNFGVGDKVVQKDIVFNKDSEELLTKLTELNVPQEEIIEVSKLINNTPKDNLGQ